MDIVAGTVLLLTHRQGDSLSPTLFNIFINDLFEELDKSNTDPVTINNIDHLSALMFADEQKSLNALDSYVKKWKLEINIKKTKCMTFSKSNHAEKHQFFIGNKILENTKEYKYLGITINKKGSFSP